MSAKLMKYVSILQINPEEISDAEEKLYKITAIISKETPLRTEKFKKWFGDWEKELEKASKIVDEASKTPHVYTKASSGRRMGDLYLLNSQLIRRKRRKFTSELWKSKIPTPYVRNELWIYFLLLARIFCSTNPHQSRRQQQNHHLFLLQRYDIFFMVQNNLLLQALHFILFSVILAKDSADFIIFVVIKIKI